MLRAAQAKGRPKLLPLPLLSSHCALIEDPTPPIVSVRAAFILKLLNCSMAALPQPECNQIPYNTRNQLRSYQQAFIPVQRPFNIET